MPISLTVLGSADAFNSGGRGNACYLVEDGRGAFCVDFGPTAMMGLKREGFEPNDLDAVFLTHLHGDHFGGLHLLLIDAQYRGRRERPLVIGGPVGTKARVEALYRLAYGSAGRKRRFETQYVEWAPGESGEAAGRKVRTFAAMHMKPGEGALHLRIRAGRSVLAFSGDTGWSGSLPELARGADLLVCECTEETGVMEQHLSWAQLEPRLDQLEARQLLISHLGEGMRRRAKSRPPPRVRFADDGAKLRIG